jgi:CspA family cold shock protein
MPRLPDQRLPDRFLRGGFGKRSRSRGLLTKRATQSFGERPAAPDLPLGVSLISFRCKHLEATLAKGTVKWFNATKGYGFIQPMGGGGRDVFVHISAVERAGLSTLNEGQTVEYEEVADRGKTSAQNLKIAGR